MFVLGTRQHKQAGLWFLLPLRLRWKRAIRGCAFASQAWMSRWQNLWISANQMLPGGLKADSEIQWSHTSQPELSTWRAISVCSGVTVFFFLSLFFFSLYSYHAIQSQCHRDSGQTFLAAYRFNCRVTATINSPQWGSDTRINSSETCFRYTWNVIPRVRHLHFYILIINVFYPHLKTEISCCCTGQFQKSIISC